MSEKTILKLYANGDLETVDTPLNQTLTISENLFSVSTIVPGYVDNGTGLLVDVGDPHNIRQGTSEFISVESTQPYTLQVKWEYTSIKDNVYGWSSISVCVYDNEFNFISAPYFLDDELTEMVTHTMILPSNAYFIRVSVSHLFHRFNNLPSVSVNLVRGSVIKPYTESLKDQIQQGKALYIFNRDVINVPTIIKYPSENMPSWVVDTGNPISIFPEGIVIKGDLI